MAFVNSVAKPPRDVRRRQEKFGTGTAAVPEKIRWESGSSGFRKLREESLVTYPENAAQAQAAARRGESSVAAVPAAESSSRGQGRVRAGPGFWDTFTRAFPFPV